MFIMLAEASHSENNGPVSECRCRLCAVGPGDSITDTFCTVHYQFVLFFIPLAKSVHSAGLIRFVHLADCPSLQTYGLLSVRLDLGPSFICWTIQPTHLLFAILQAVHQSTIRPLGWWTSCGLRTPTVSEGRIHLSASGSRKHTRTHAHT